MSQGACKRAAGRGRRRGDCRGDGGVGAHTSSFPARKSSRGRWRTHNLGTSPKPGLPQLDLEGEASILAKTRRSPSKVAASSLTESSREAPEPLAVMPE